MAIIYENNFKYLNSTKRIESEFYQPKNTLLCNTLLRLNVIPLRKLCSHTIMTGHTPSMKNKSYYDGNINFIKTDNLRENEIREEFTHTLTEKGNCIIQRSQLNENDIIVTIIGATYNIIGRACIIDSKLLPANINQNIALIRTDNTKTSPEYVLAYILSKYGRSYLHYLSRQTEQVNLNCVEVGDLLVPIFTNDFQKKIKEVVNLSREAKRKSDDLYKNSEFILLQETNILDWNPQHTKSFIKNYSNTQHSFRIDAEHYQPKYDEMLSRIPQNVQLLPLRKFVIYKKGIEVGGNEYKEKGKYFIRVSNLTKYGFDEQNINFISESLYEDLKVSFEPKQGEILLSKDATPGIAYYLTDHPEGIISSGILRLQFINNIPPYYLELVLNSLLVQMQIEKQAGGSIIIHWKPNEVMRTLIPRINDTIEKKINNLVEQSHQQRKLSNQLIAIAKHGIEKAIETSETEAENFLNEELENFNVNINSNN